MLNKIIVWLPRILSFLFVAFLLLFSFDVFSANATVGDKLIAFLIHNIPAFVLLTVTIISFKYEIIGGIFYLAAGIIYIFMVNVPQNFIIALSWYLAIAGPALIIGILYLFNWYLKKNKNHKSKNNALPSEIA